MDGPWRTKSNKPDPQEKISFSNRINTDLVAEFKVIEPPPTDRFFDTYTESREETKQSLQYNKRYNDQRKTSSKVHNTDTTLYDIQLTRGNHSYISDQSISLGDINKTDISAIVPNTSDSMDVSRKVNLNIKINSKISRMNSGSRKARDLQEAYSNNITISSLIKRRGKDRNLANFLSIKETNIEIEQNSGPDSPYFSTNVKALRSNKLEHSANISENPLNAVMSFNKRFSHVAAKLENRFEMNIQDSHIEEHISLKTPFKSSGSNKSPKVFGDDYKNETQLVFPKIIHKTVKKNKSHKDQLEVNQNTKISGKL